MLITDIFTAKALAAHWTETASNRIPYLGQAFFPNDKKMGLDLKWIRGHKGLPVSLAPSNFNAKSTLRSREGFKIDNTQMAFFRESMLVKEEDEQEIMRVLDSNDPYAADVLSRIFNDQETLVDGALVVAERMRMQLLCPTVDGSPRIVISADGVQYSYNYDPDTDYKTNHYKAITTTSKKWTDVANSDPLTDLRDAQDKVEELTGVRPTRVLMNRVTFNKLLDNARIKAAILAQNATANIFMDDDAVKNVLKKKLNLTVIIYNKQYKDETGTVQKFYADGYCTLLPEGNLGKTWRGVTPEERKLMGKPQADVSIVEGGIAVAVTVTDDPVNTKTTVSEIVLPSYERMDETYVIKAF